MKKEPILASYTNPEYVDLVAAGLTRMGRLGPSTVAHVNDEGQLVITDGERTVIFEAMR